MQIFANSDATLEMSLLQDIKNTEKGFPKLEFIQLCARRVPLLLESNRFSLLKVLSIGRYWIFVNRSVLDFSQQVGIGFFQQVGIGFLIFFFNTDLLTIFFDMFEFYMG